VWTTNYHMQVIPDLLRCWDFSACHDSDVGQRSSWRW
jgi:hypothetical protein